MNSKQGYVIEFQKVESVADGVSRVRNIPVLFVEDADTAHDRVRALNERYIQRYNYLICKNNLQDVKYPISDVNEEVGVYVTRKIDIATETSCNGVEGYMDELMDDIVRKAADPIFNHKEDC